MSTVSSNEDGKMSKNRRLLSQQAQQLRNHCDRILDRSIPLVLETNLLILITTEIYSLLSNNPTPLKESLEETKYQDKVMFLHDVFEQTPSLCVSLSETSNASFSLMEGNYVDLTLFHHLEFLELRKVNPRTIIGLNSVKKKLRRIKCCRCLDSLEEILSEAHSSSAPIIVDNTGGRREQNSNITCVWPELKDIDFSFNRLGSSTPAWNAFELTPSVENLNLSRNLISTIDEIFSKTLPTLTVLNLSYNKLTFIPPLPPNVRVLILAHNCITFVGNTSAGQYPDSPGVNQMSFKYGDRNSSFLKNLETLDLSTNMISEESEIIALEQITGLKCLSLIGNPLSYLDNYRHTVISHLSLACVNRGFTLDKKKLSNSEIRWNKEQSKNPKFTPFVPAYSPKIAHDSAYKSLYSPLTSADSSMDSNTPRTSKVLHLKQLSSLTQSYDSSSSSVRSLSRKKPKIREMVDFKDPSMAKEDGVLSGVSRVLHSSRRKPKKSKSGRNSSCSSVKSSSSSDTSSVASVEVMTKETIASLRARYGAENWLLRQAGSEVSKLLGIQEMKLPETAMPPPCADSSCENCGTQYGGDIAPSTNVTVEKNESLESSPGDVALPIEVHSSPGEDSCSTMVNTPEDDKAGINSPENTPTSASVVETSIFAKKLDDNNEPVVPLTTVLASQSSEKFTIFHMGEIFKLAVNNGYLYEVDPLNMQCIAKWDLKSLKSMIKQPLDSDTDTVTFCLKFDTMRKKLREKSFIMSQKDFAAFDACVAPFITENTLHEFAEAMQCMKCNAQFCKAMAVRSVKQSKSGAPKEVLVCPNPDCESDMLVTLDVTPLPNNECFDVERELDNASPILRKGSYSRKSSSSGKFYLGLPLPKSVISTHFQFN